MGALAVGSGAVARAADKQPQPWLRLKLEALGYPGTSSALVGAGASVLTVNFLDDSHLLVTYGTRGLVPRVVGDPPDHDDRMVAAEVVDLPAGNVEARTEWHMHDHARYLWNLGGGRFLVRIGDDLSTMQPLANLGGGKAFERLRFTHEHFRPGVVVVSPDKSLLTMETGVKLDKGAPQWGDVPENVRVSPTLVEFYRVKPVAAELGGVQLDAAGRLLAPQMMALPLSADGTLWAEPKQRNGWAISFDDYDGKSIAAGELGSTCDPQLQMVSRSQYVAVTCMGGGDLNKLAAYGLDGHEAWEEPLGGLDEAVFALAPEAGRFALLRTVEAVASPQDAAGGGTTERQELRVYQTESGDLLMKSVASPMFRTAENFDLSEDGSLAMVVRDGQIVVYKLAAPDKRDLEDLKKAEKFSPPEARSGPLVLRRLTEALSAKAAPPARAASPAGAGTAAPGAMAAAKGKGAAEESAVGAAVATERRTPPTLMLPGEKPEFGKANPQPLPGATDDEPPAPDASRK